VCLLLEKFKKGELQQTAIHLESLESNYDKKLLYRLQQITLGSSCIHDQASQGDPQADH
jgi:hypothetical protein